MLVLGRVLDTNENCGSEGCFCSGQKATLVLVCSTMIANWVLIPPSHLHLSFLPPKLPTFAIECTARLLAGMWMGHWLDELNPERCHVIINHIHPLTTLSAVRKFSLPKLDNIHLKMKKFAYPLIEWNPTFKVVQPVWMDMVVYIYTIVLVEGTHIPPCLQRLSQCRIWTGWVDARYACREALEQRIVHFSDVALGWGYFLVPHVGVYSDGIKLLLLPPPIRTHIGGYKWFPHKRKMPLHREQGLFTPSSSPPW